MKYYWNHMKKTASNANVGSPSPRRQPEWRYHADITHLQDNITEIAHKLSELDTTDTPPVTSSSSRHRTEPLQQYPNTELLRGELEAARSVISERDIQIG
eukprot:PhM_4_TR11799/c0_g1_i1/m.44910